MSSIAEQTTPTIPCMPWCARGDGFDETVHPDDRVCMTPEDRTPLSLHDVVQEGDGTWQLDYATVYAMVWPGGHCHAHVHIGQGEDCGPRLTPNEARSVARALITAADIAERP